MIETHTETSGHNHVVTHQRCQVIKALLTEIIMLHIGIIILLHIRIHTCHSGRKSFIRVVLSHITQLVFGQISGNIGIFNTRCKQAADNEYLHHIFYYLHIQNFFS